MIDHGVMTAEPTILSSVEHRDQPVGVPVSLEQRVRRLEDAVAQLQDTRQLEDRIAGRVVDRVSAPAVSVYREPESPLATAGRQLLPAALGLLKAETERAELEPHTVPLHTETRRPWLVFEAVAEGRTILRMLLDPRYRRQLSWTTRIVPVVIVVFILTSQWLMPWNLIPLIGPLFDKAVGIVLAFFAYKVLCRELPRYREWTQEWSMAGHHDDSARRQY